VAGKRPARLERKKIMAQNKNSAAPTNFSDLLALLENVGVSATDVENILHNAERERESVALATAILAGDDTHEGKMFPADSRPAEFQSVDAVRDAFFAFAATVTGTIVLTPANPTGGNKNTRTDRREIELPTPDGRLVVRLYHD
jgi:hypothetical protein